MGTEASKGKICAIGEKKLIGRWYEKIAVKSRCLECDLDDGLCEQLGAAHMSIEEGGTECCLLSDGSCTAWIACEPPEPTAPDQTTTELLEAAEAIMPHIEREDGRLPDTPRYRAALADLRAAIAKARGRG